MWAVSTERRDPVYGARRDAAAAALWISCAQTLPPNNSNTLARLYRSVRACRWVCPSAPGGWKREAWWGFWSSCSLSPWPLAGRLWQRPQFWCALEGPAAQIKRTKDKAGGGLKETRAQIRKALLCRNLERFCYILYIYIDYYVFYLRFFCFKS